MTPSHRFAGALLRGVTVLLVYLALLTAVTRGEEPEAKKKNYNSSTAISLLLSQGNNKTLSFSFDTDQNFGFKRNLLNFKGNILATQTNGEKKSEVYYSHLKFNREFGSRAYLVTLARAERNKLAGFNARYALSAGGGFTWVKTERVQFLTDLALGCSSENTSQKVPLGDMSGTSLEKTITSSFLTAILTAKITWVLSKNSRFVQQGIGYFNMEDTDNTRWNTLSSLSASINPNLGLKMSIQVNYEQNPVPGYKSTDVFFVSSLVITI